ncbi:uncharacterized protein LOC120842768 [Ixodes scapularis]|uniref:uncharacterized protein LOC120842768 n=1 Tax=Ixodes scapularis TaxID=6945 RepID=UPI001A9CF5E4|nr:uncharacterized protein LOC120842768 [Ixodes scapularis]
MIGVINSAWRTLSINVSSMASRRRNVALITIGAVGVASLFFYWRQDDFVRLKPVLVDKDLDTRRPGYAVYTAGCKIPDFNPFHWTVASIYRKQHMYACPGRPSFIKLVGNVPSINEVNLWDYYQKEPKSVVCFYQDITRNENKTVPDSEVLYSTRTRLVFGVPLLKERVFVECSSAGAKFHEEFLIVPVLKESVETRCEEATARANSSAERLNVVIIGLDSVSRLNSLRHLKKTRSFLFDNFDVIELYGYNKVGDNSFPNQLPLLTGLSDKEVLSLSPDRYYDNQDFIWDTYADLGYRTLFMEESPRFGLFNYFSNGFREIPTDYYTRPAILAIDTSKQKRFIGGGKGCVGSRVQTEMYLEYTTSLLSFLGNRSYFTYTWISDVTHDNLNSAGYADTPFLRAFERLQKNGVMNKSLVVFLSDHGMRYGPIRRTLVGKYEDRLPFAFLMFPPEFRRKYPEAVRNLKINQYRLTTHYDLHATLLELANFPNRNSSFKTSHGLSLLHEIPESRTCKEASIDAHWCCCHETGDFPAAHRLSRKMARFVLGTVNGWLQEGAPGKCKTLRLQNLIDVYEVSVDPNGDSRYFWVTLSATPGGAFLEATVAVNSTEGMSAERVSRLDWYGAQSSCVKSHFLELYCVCKK